MITKSSYTMDSLYEILPEELVRQIQKYTTHQICEDSYFKYHKMNKMHRQVVQKYNFKNKHPEYMFDMMAVDFNMEFSNIMGDLDYTKQGKMSLHLYLGNWNEDYIAEQVYLYVHDMISLIGKGESWESS